MPTAPSFSPARRLLFHRDFQRYSGGHGKMKDYFDHARDHPGWSPVVHLTPDSRNEHNPWRTDPAVTVEADWRPDRADALLLGGTDWTAYPRDHSGLPVINLVQGVRHGDPADPRHAFLQRPAIRICVSRGVADAISRSASPKGPVFVIEPGLELPGRPPSREPRDEVFIDAVKQPALGRALAERLLHDGFKVRLSDQRLPRTAYLDQLARAGIAVLLPRDTEGFYLPGVEAMALGCAVVVPDSIGNRAYLEPGGNALVPPMALEPLAQAVAQLRDDALRSRLVAAGRQRARDFDMARERKAFHRVLDDIDALWQAALSG